ncbi:MAG: hypothetical protein GWP14_02235 [Actinobacteria bacterium]|nr:hypothetical protein [Actinomycetota bacterium]
MSANPRTIIIGLDGVPFGMLKAFADAGVMPCTRAIIRDGFFTPMQSSIPEVSSVAWPSIITGHNPGQHGIFGFVDMIPDSYKFRFPNFKDLKAEPFWNLCSGQAVIVNVPSTYPVRPMNGVHISGFVSIDFEKSVYPQSLLLELRKLDYRLDVDARKAHTAMDEFLQDVDKSLTARIKAHQFLWDNYDWQVFMLVFTGTDRLMHFLWDAYEDPAHKHHDFFLDHFKKIDQAIAEITAKLTAPDSLIILSDHGFEKLEKEVYVNHLLASEGFLAFEQGAEPKPVNMASATKAFALDPARLYINQKGKFQAGSVSEADKSACLADLEQLFSSLEIDGRKVIKHIYRKQDIYAGPHLNSAPDLVLLADTGFNLKGAMTSKQLAAKGPFTGKHTYPDAFLLVNNKDLTADLSENPCVTDAGKLIKSCVS